MPKIINYSFHEATNNYHESRPNYNSSAKLSVNNLMTYQNELVFVIALAEGGEVKAVMTAPPAAGGDLG